ncbi:protein kinase superfamily protein [Actinidia rufa]|uniref:Protein kinase superfamily protein n=1 Tax=Actinidia rufa TaxID=165716 RepID=A0A7J0H4R5_9ERIC|nr:protein kinase superfamily protein [Actinidia rufa]
MGFVILHSSIQGHKEWINEVKFLDVVEHPNLVKLVSYCAEDDEREIQRLLVYELMHNKSLEDHLMAWVASPLPWMVGGTVGYAAPEYVQTGKLTAKSDVWIFGVVLYELITGMRALERNLPQSEQKLLEWMRPYVSHSKKFHLIFDPRIEGQYCIKSAQKLARNIISEMSSQDDGASQPAKETEDIREETEEGSGAMQSGDQFQEEGF